MSSRDKHYIRESTCAKFGLETLKAAREVLYTTCEPTQHYGYQGPHVSKNTELERMHDAFEGIYSKLVKLDADKQMPSFSVPSAELLCLLKINTAEHTTCESKFKKLGEDFEELKNTLHSFVSIVTSKSNPPETAIPPVTRSRLMSTGSTGSLKRNADDWGDEENFPSLTEADDDKEQPFEFPRRQRQMLAKRAKLSNNVGTEKKETYVDRAKMNSKPKPPSTKGTAKPTNNFRGAVSDIFMSNCDTDVTTNDIEEHFKGHHVKIKSIEKRSHNLALRKSFRISPATKEDYEKIMQTDLLPEEVEVRKYIPRRWTPDDNQHPRMGRSQFKSASNSGVRTEDYRQLSAELEQIELQGTNTAKNGSPEIEPK